MAKRKSSSGKAYNTNETANVQSDKSRFSDSEKTLRADAKQNREQILHAAYKIFVEKGLSIPISEIAREARVGIGTIYRHFPNKESLLEEVYLSYKQQLTEEAKALMNNTDPGKAFFDFFISIMEDGFNNKALKDALNTRMASSDVLQDFQWAFSNLLTRAQQAKAVREDIDIKDVITIMMGFLLAIEQRKGDLDISRFSKLVSIVCDGLQYGDTVIKST